MTPNDPAGKRTSGNPATQAQLNLTVKQQREQQKQQKLAEYQRQLAKRRRTKATWWIVGTTAAIVVIGLVAASYFLTPRPVSIARGDGDGAGISGVQTFEHTANHVEGVVDYEQTPPAGGDHNAIWLNCGVYTQPVPNENAVHALEHGAIWITYDPAQVDAAGIDALKAELPRDYTVLSPYEDMDTPIAVSAWNAQLKVDSPDDERIGEFIKAYWRNTNGPEPGAACTGALDAPGKQ
ncbi:hypothetical protein QE428_001721 [Microbacterium sp. SORGH_AS 505]|uniref:DUF3105 domain-containing protein n=1 Tax=Microbacterium oleivorans TaxID=273677 RepID=A0A4R5YIL3_9MICO|nr:MULTISPECIES: DUF3105 domain-containing protein [Microbacterium]MDQ1126688.1 hypothetical protein [Microbacterium sp. SORGH_AS_0505]TDL45174.1 DUF3105 domain-containing protein [Microbacterium oleivorans]